MKKKIFVIVVVFTVGLSLSACSEEKSKEGPVKQVTYTKDFGTYEVPSNWEENEEESQQGMYVYLEKGTDMEKPFCSFAVGTGESNCLAEDHEAFREFVLASWDVQMEKMGGGTLDEDSMTSEQGYYVYVINYTDIRGIPMTQYLIPGDYKYCIVQTLNTTESKECDELTKQVMNSFRWSDVEASE